MDGNATASYAYDAAGRRVSTTVAGGTTLRFFDPQGRTVRRIDPSGQWLSSEIYALGQPLATYDQSGAEGMTWFMDVDPVGTVRTLTNGSGQFAQACTSLPFGDDQACSPAISDPSPLHFTGKPRDAETGLDDFGARLYSSSLGRWMTPDWSAQAEPVPYAKLDNPQSLNLYAYVLNNPVSSVDPDGHCALGLFGHGCTVYQRVANLFTGKGWRTDAELAKVTVTTTTTVVGISNAINNTGQVRPNVRTPATGEPNSKATFPDSRGGKTVRLYGPDGKAAKDVDYGHDHGSGDPHVHDWDHNKTPPRGPGRPLLPGERLDRVSVTPIDPVIPAVPDIYVPVPLVLPDPVIVPW